MEYDDYVVEERLQKDFSIYHRQRKKNGSVYSKKLREFVNTILNEAKTFVNDNGLQHVVTTNMIIFNRAASMFSSLRMRTHVPNRTLNYRRCKMAGILFEDIFDVKDIDPDGKKFERGEHLKNT